MKKLLISLHKQNTASLHPRRISMSFYHWSFFPSSNCVCECVCAHVHACTCMCVVCVCAYVADVLTKVTSSRSYNSYDMMPGLTLILWMPWLLLLCHLAGSCSGVSHIQFSRAINCCETLPLTNSTSSHFPWNSPLIPPPSVFTGQQAATTTKADKKLQNPLKNEDV